MKRAFPPMMVSSVTEMAYLLIGPSWGVYLLRLPGFSTTTASLPLYPKMPAHAFSIAPFNHMNLYLVPLSIFLSYLAFKASNSSLRTLVGFSAVMSMTHSVPSVARQISLALLWCS